mgnify:FL=1
MFNPIDPNVPNYDKKLHPLLYGLDKIGSINFFLSKDDPIIDYLLLKSHQIAEEKQKEAPQKSENLYITSRFLNGFLGEYAVEKMTSLNFSDHSIGMSTEYNIPDMQGCEDGSLRVGVKTFSYIEEMPTIDQEGFVSGKQYSRFPLINYQPYIESSQLLVLRRDEKNYHKLSSYNPKNDSYDTTYPNGFYHFTLLGYVCRVDLMDSKNLYHRFVQHLPLYPRKTNFIGLDKTIPLHGYAEYDKMSVFQQDKYLSLSAKISRKDFSDIEVLKKQIYDTERSSQLGVVNG